MAGTSLFFDIMARDHASAVFNKVGAAADRLGKQTDRAGKAHSTFGKAVRWAGGMVSLYGAGQFLKSSIQAYADAETAQNRLAASYKRFPAMQNVALESFKDLNTQLMLHTRFDDDDAAAMQANLSRFDLTGKQIQRLTPLMADLAQVQGTDLVTAGGNFGKAILGNTRALKALGISYTSTGDRAKDMRNIVRLLNEKVGGESARAATTTAAKMAMLGNQWGELKETVGLAVLPAFSKLATVAGPAITGLQQTVQRNMPQIKQTFEDVWAAAKKLAGIGKGLWDGFSSMPEGTRQLLLALAGGTWAVGKIRGSALGQGIGSIFSAVKGMNVNAGVVNVNGKVGGGPAAGGGKGGLPGMVSKASAGSMVASLGLTSIGLAITSAIAVGIEKGISAHYGDSAAGTKRWMRDVNQSRLGDGSQRGQQSSTSTGGGIRQPNLPNNSGRLRAEASGFREASTAAKGHADTLTRLTGAETKWGLAATAASLKGTIGARGVASAVKGIPDKKTSRISTPGAEESRGRVKGLGGAIGGLKGKTVGVKEAGAEQSRGRVKGLGASISALRPRTIPIKADTSQAIQGIGAVAQALTNLDGRTANTYVRQHNVKGAAGGGLIRGPGTSTSDSIPAMLSNGEYVIQAESVRKIGRGFLDAINAGQVPGFKKGGSPWPKLPPKPGKGASDEQKRAYDRAVSNLEAAKAAAADATWQKRLAKTVNDWSLGDDVASWLSGMDKGAVKTLLANPKGKAAGIKNIKRLAGKSNAFNAQSDLRAARGEWDTWNGERRWATQAAQQNIADAQSKISDAQAVQRDPKASAKAKAEAYRDEIEWVQKLQEAQKDQADAEAQAAELAAQQQDAALDKVNQLRDAVDGAAKSFRDYGSIGTTAVNDLANAQSKLTDANDKVADAQKRLDLAGSDRERAAAASELSKALGEQQTAQQNAASAGKPTSASIRGNMASRLAKIRDFSSAVKTLQSQGLNATTLSDILQMGPEQGYDFAKALLDGGLGDINELQNQITQQSASLGYFATQTGAASDQLTGAAAAQQIGVTITPAPITLTLDGQVIAQAMQAYNRQMGR